MVWSTHALALHPARGVARARARGRPLGTSQLQQYHGTVPQWLRTSASFPGQSSVHAALASYHATSTTQRTLFPVPETWTYGPGYCLQLRATPTSPAAAPLHAGRATDGGSREPRTAGSGRCIVHARSFPGRLATAADGARGRGPVAHVRLANQVISRAWPPHRTPDGDA